MWGSRSRVRSLGLGFPGLYRRSLGCRFRTCFALGSLGRRARLPGLSRRSTGHSFASAGCASKKPGMTIMSTKFSTRKSTIISTTFSTRKSTIMSTKFSTRKSTRFDTKLQIKSTRKSTSKVGQNFQSLIEAVYVIETRPNWPGSWPGSSGRQATSRKSLSNAPQQRAALTGWGRKARRY